MARRHTCGIDGDPGAVAPLDGHCDVCDSVKGRTEVEGLLTECRKWKLNTTEFADLEDDTTDKGYSQLVKIDYTNWKQERSTRTILPERIFFGQNEWHKEQQWLLEALDVEKKQMRTFAIKNIHLWSADKV